MDQLIIEARINEYAMRSENPHVPWSSQEITDDAVRCREAGASIVHFHSRTPDGAPEHRYESYAETISQIRERTDILIHPTLGAATNDVSAAERIETVVRLASDPATRPDLAPMDMGSANLDFYDQNNQRFYTNDVIYKNSTATLEHFAGAISDARMKHYVVSWNIGFTRQTLAFMDMGLLPEPIFLLFVLTDGALLAGHPGTAAGLDAHLAMLPRDRKIEWAVCNHGGDMLPLVDKVIGEGGHIAIGLGDHSYAKNEPMNNAELIAQVANRAAAAGRPLTDPQTVRAQLKM
jgi:uncharacterized protein (DUF849 family)